MVHMCKMIISAGIFFSFSKFCIFWVVRRVKRQKMVQHGKKSCPLRFTSQEPYIIWLSFMVHMCKMIISAGVFFSFSKFWFFGLSGGWKVKKLPKMRKNSACLTLCLRNRNDCDFWCTCVRWWYLQQIFSFFKILIFGVFMRVKGQKMT